ncbi:porin [Flaviaesturariibacter amylovorans]|uniref:OprO/OprP family phosphate-selective porin n=1 Tax=Flaviaesturariibacter amylovorans TaxID=1084520 RepID=A0ABP8HI49_9BACT
MNKLLRTLGCTLGLVASTVLPATAQKDSAAGQKPSKWFDKISIRGYMQVRYNRLLETNPQLKCDQCDRSIGEDGGLFVRRMRVIIFGQVSERVYFYVQPDFASSVGTTQHIGQIRDMYIDLGLDKKNEYRLRLGQSKIPFGFENMQSSQNRMPLDRADALNSALSNERDLAALFYWAPRKIRDRFSELVSEGYKGSGDYGVVGFGVFNGQTANRPEQNDQLHVVGRVAYPFAVGNQIIEPALQAYTGRYVVTADQLSAGVKVRPGGEYTDERVAATFVLYPRPFGIHAEYNVGRGPEFNPVTDSIETRRLEGGYVTLHYMLKAGKQFFFPFVRGQYYSGGKKFETDARSYTVRDLEIGLEWQPMKNFEFVAEYMISDRRFEDFRKQHNRQRGNLLRLQAQLNF